MIWLSDQKLEETLKKPKQKARKWVTHTPYCKILFDHIINSHP